MAGAFFLSLVLFLLLSRRFLFWLKKKKMVDYFRIDSPSSHQKKKGTPTGGGLLFLLCIAVSFFLLGNFTQYIFLSLLVIFYLGLAGFLDDIIKRFRKSSRGLPGKVKLLLQMGIALFLGIYIYLDSTFTTRVEIPFTNFQIELGFIYILLVLGIILGSTNAVNLSDGLDGLTAGCMISPAAIFILLAYIQEDAIFSSLFNRPYLPGAGEVGILWCALLGAIVGFLHYNRYPARLFMGGVGSEALGGILGISALLLKGEILLLLLGGVFIAEALSVIIQVTSFQLTGRRVFKMTPLHHHFELKGIKESRIVTGFWIASALFSTLAFLSLFY
jgi:phospho-N-acetylmuramoyl-pentapeptide-transferase